MDLATAQDKLAAVQSAYDKAVTGLTVWYGDMRITRQNVDILRQEMAYWQRTVLALTAQAQGASGDLSVRTPKWT